MAIDYRYNGNDIHIESVYGYSKYIVKKEILSAKKHKT